MSLTQKNVEEIVGIVFECLSCNYVNLTLL